MPKKNPLSTNKFHSLLSAVLVLSACLAGLTWAQTSYDLDDETITVYESGRLVTLEPALDEVWLVLGDGTSEGIETIPVRRDAEALAFWLESVNFDNNDQRYMVLYPSGVARTDLNRRVFMRQVLVKLDNAGTESTVAGAHGFSVVQGTATPDGWVALEAGSVLDAFPRLSGLEADSRVATVDLDFGTYHEVLGYNIGGGEPNDEFYQTTGEPFFQWHHQTVNTFDVWDTAGLNITGNNILICVVDNGMEQFHPDLQFNNSPPHLNTIAGQDPADPDPMGAFDHGTAVAGVSAGVGNNAIGIVGMAPDADLTAVKIFQGNSGNLSATQVMTALDHRSGAVRVSNNSWGPGVAFSPLAGVVETTLANNAMGGLVYCWAAGNSSLSGRRTDYVPYSVSPYTIAVGAITQSSQGGGTLTKSSYSEEGSALDISAPSNAGFGQPGPGIRTTSNEGIGDLGNDGGPSGADYTQFFGGTSSACPLISGVVADILEANPALTYREVKHCLITTADSGSLTGGAFVPNGAGIPFSYLHGAGMVDPAAAVTAAAALTPFTAEETITSTQSPGVIPDGGAPVVSTFDFSAEQALEVEHVIVNVDFAHPDIGDLQIVLTSPSGMQSVLHQAVENEGYFYAGSSAVPDWPFLSVRHWGELSNFGTGQWTVSVQDQFGGDAGSIDSITVEIRGHVIAPPANLPPEVTSAQVTSAEFDVPNGCAYEDLDLTLTNVVATDPEGDPITLAYQWQQSGENISWSNMGGETGAILPAASISAEMAYRCGITPSDDQGNTGDLFYTTNYMCVNTRPILTFSQAAGVYTYDAGLFLLQTTAVGNGDVVINEFSQGITGNQEWVELLTIRASLDLGGVFLSNGYGGRDIMFLDVPFWRNIPAGTMIVIYNNDTNPWSGLSERDPQLPANDYDRSDRRVVVPSNHPSLFLQPASPTGWGEIVDNIEDNINLTTYGDVLIFGMSINGDISYIPTLPGNIGHDPAESATYCVGASVTDYLDPAKWMVRPAYQGGLAIDPNISPGSPNGDPVAGPNKAFIDNLIATGGIPAGGGGVIVYSFGPATSAAVDPGQGGSGTIDSDTGLITWTPTGLGPFTFEVVKSAPLFGTSTSQIFTLTVTAGAPAPAPAANSDDDNDGVSYLMELALNLDPSIADISWQPSGTTNAGDGETGGEAGKEYLTIEFRRLTGGTLNPTTMEYVVDHPDAPLAKQIVYRVECGSNLDAWHSGSDQVMQVSALNLGDMETVTFRATKSIEDAASEDVPCQFMRLVVEEREKP